MERTVKIKEKGFVTIYALAALAALALLMAIALRWAVETKTEGRMLADLQRVISALDIGMAKAKADYPNPVNFVLKAQDILIFTGEFSQQATNEATTEVPALIQFSWEEVRPVVLKTAVTAEARVGKAGTVARTKVAYSSVLVPE